MELRELEPKDAEQLSQLIIQNLRQVIIQDYAQEIVDKFVPYYAPEKVIERSAHQQILVCIAEGNVVGTATLDKDRVRDVFVDLARHRSGIGTAVMAAIEARALENRQTNLFLLSNVAATGFYEKLGYQVVERFENDLDGIPLLVVKMEKTLIIA
ncbi:MAG: GNAT family N-acetyltransferase [Chloroflexi bacterium]|nr:GNAT family N-acetyltransferase [Chloroflexota bacterium]